jgi:hypothetical protein
MMKTERMTLLIAPDDKAAITARAESLGMSVSELVRQAAMGYDPEERAYLDELARLVPDLKAAAQDMRESLARAFAAAEETRVALADRETYRDRLRQTMEADTTINWAGIQRILGFDQLAQDRAA